MKERFHINKNCIWIAIVHWILTFFTDHLVFSYVMWDTSNLTQMVKTAMTYGAKAVFLFLLFGLYQGIWYFFTRVDKKQVRYTLIYFGICMAALLLTWPGIWRMDEFGILNSAVQLLPVFWQSYLTSLFYVFAMMFLPFPAGIIIVQFACISLIVGKMVKLFVDEFGKSGLWAFLPALFLPVMDSNLYPMRMSLYGFLELLLMALLFSTHKKLNKDNKKEIRKDNKKEITKDNKKEIKQDHKKEGKTGFFLLMFLAAIVTVWRTEAVYYVLLFPILLWILFYKREQKKSLVKLTCIYLVITLALLIPQKLGDKLTSGNQYDLTSVVLPLVPMLEEASEKENCKELLDTIDQVINVDLAVAGAKEGRSGISLFWGEADFQRDYTDDQYKEFKNAYYKLILKCPKAFLTERFTSFVHCNGLLENTTELFTREDVPNYETFQKYPLTKPVNNSLRNGAISMLELRSLQDYDSTLPLYGIVYSALIPIAILLLFWLVALLKRKWKLFFLISLPLVKVPLIFLTAPSKLFMYYYSVYLIGYFAILYFVLRVWKRIAPFVHKTIVYCRRNGLSETIRAVRERTDSGAKDVMSQRAEQYVGDRYYSFHAGQEELEQYHETLRARTYAYEPLVSIVVPAYETKELFLRQLMESVMEQTYGSWELVIADASTTDCVKVVVDEYRKILDTEQKCKKAIISYHKLTNNAGISENTNVGILAAKGDYIALLDHDDLLTRDALSLMVEKLQGEKIQADAKITAVYSDEDKCDTELTRFYEPNLKPDFNLDLLLSNNYICHFLMVEADTMKRLLLRGAYDGAQDYDLILRLAEEPGAFLHVPQVLYHWRCHEGSTAANTESKRYAYEAGKRALESYYERNGMQKDVVVTDSVHLGFYRTEYKKDIFALRSDVRAICGRVVRNGVIVAGPKWAGMDLFAGMKVGFGGYMHRAELYLDADEADERAIRYREQSETPSWPEERKQSGAEENAAKGRILYDPDFIVEIQ